MRMYVFLTTKTQPQCRIHYNKERNNKNKLKEKSAPQQTALFLKCSWWGMMPCRRRNKSELQMQCNVSAPMKFRL